LNRDPEAPWNPQVPVKITPTEFEGQVFSWLKQTHPQNGCNLKATHSATVTGEGGSYQIDILVRLTILGGAEITVLVECKHKGRPVERSDVLELESKLRDTAAHKGMLFSTSGFQKGALEYATAHGIATVIVTDGKYHYETRGGGPRPTQPPPWIHFDTYAGIRLTSKSNTISCHAISMERVDALTDWLSEKSAER
jgi:restriction system protein